MNVIILNYKSDSSYNTNTIILINLVLARGLKFNDTVSDTVLYCT